MSNKLLISAKGDSIIAASEVEDTLSSKLSANALFNFMREYEYLENTLTHMAFLPRYYPENVEYLELKYDNKKLREWYIPMTCFCDIPLHQIAYHADGIKKSGYGRFAIAVHKSFGIVKGIQPIQYLNVNSIQRQELTKSLNTLFENSTSLPDNDDVYSSLSNYLLEQMRTIKPISGKMSIIKEGKKESLKKNFHDEHEWRYIPSFQENELPYMLIQEDEMMASDVYTQSISKTKHGLLHFGVEDLRYIFVNTIADRDRLIKFIRSKSTGKRLSRSEKDVLISKISVYDELKEDW